MGMNANDHGGSKSEINVTPLVDVCLVLLIIFMVLVPKAVPEISVRVPPDDADPKHRRNSEDSLVVIVDAQGGIRLGEDPVSPKLLEQRLSASLADRERRVVFLDCDPAAEFADAVAVLDIAKRAGADVLGVVARRDEPVPERLLPR